MYKLLIVLVQLFWFVSSPSFADSRQCQFDRLLTEKTVRGVHIILRKHSPETVVEFAQKAVANKFNTIFLQLATDTVPLDALSRIPKKESSWTKVELVSVVSKLLDLGLVIVPEIKLLTHQEKFLGIHYPEFMYNRSTYDPRNDGLYSEVVFPVLDELISIFPCGAIHIGHDEVAGHSPKSRKKWLDNGDAMLPAEYFENDILKVYHYLDKSSVSVLVWGDMFISELQFPTMAAQHLHGNKEGYGQRLLRNLPKSMVIVDWHYVDKQRDFPSLEYFVDQGFRVLGSVWKRPSTIENFTKYAREHGASGMVVTTWSDYMKPRPGRLKKLLEDGGRDTYLYFSDDDGG